MMRDSQLGVSLGGLLVASVILVFAALLGLKLLPAYLEYFTAKKAITAIAQERQGASVADIRKAFDARAQIDDIKSITAQDLEITKEGGQVVIAFEYRAEVPLFANIGVFINFSGSSAAR